MNMFNDLENDIKYVNEDHEKNKQLNEIIKISRIKVESFKKEIDLKRETQI